MGRGGTARGDPFRQGRGRGGFGGNAYGSHGDIQFGASTMVVLILVAHMGLESTFNPLPDEQHFYDDAL